MMGDDDRWFRLMVDFNRSMKPGDELPLCLIYERLKHYSFTELFDRQYEVYGPEWNPDSQSVF